MGVRVVGTKMHLVGGEIDLDHGTPTKELIFTPDPHSVHAVILTCINVKDMQSRFRIENGEFMQV